MKGESTVDTPIQPSYYTPWQVSVATLIAGPLGGGIFAYRNHKLFGAPKKARNTFLITGVLLAGLILLSLLLPRSAGRTFLALLVAGSYRWYAEAAFGTEIAKRRDEGWTRASWWPVLGLSLLIFIGVLVCIAAFLVVQTAMTQTVT